MKTGHWLNLSDRTPLTITTQIIMSCVAVFTFTVGMFIVFTLLGLRKLVAKLSSE